MASELKVNTLTGVSTAGSIAVTGEGNSTTTNLQQGLAKGWVNFDQNTPAIEDSFNTSSLTDTSTGRGSLNWTNVMSNTIYATPSICSYVSASNPYAVTLVDDHLYNNKTASKFGFSSTYSSSSTTSFFDPDRGQVSVLGDLA